MNGHEFILINDEGLLTNHFFLNRNAPYMPAIAIVTSSIVRSMRLTTASGVGGERMKYMPRNSGVCVGGVSHGGNKTARMSTTTIPYSIARLS